MKTFEEVPVWGLAFDLSLKIYEISGLVQFAKDYALRDQIRRAANSISSNIAEGHDLDTDKQYIRHLYIAKGSAAEVRSQLFLAKKLGYISDSDYATIKEICLDVSKQLSGFIQYLYNKEESV